MNKVIKLGMLFHEGEIPDFGSIQQKTENPNILYLIAEDVPKLNGMLTKTATESYLPEGSRFGFHTGTLAFVVDHQTASSGKIYVYHRSKDHWYEFNIRSDLGLCELMWNRYETILRETKTISGTPPLTFKSNGRPLKNYRIYGNTVNGESVGDLVTEGEHTGKYCIPVTVNNTTTNLYISEPLRKVGEETDYIDYAEQKQHKIPKNILNYIATTKNINGVSFEVNDDKSITCNGETTNKVTDFYLIGSVNSVGELPITLGKSYTISGFISNSAYIRILGFGYTTGFDVKSERVFNPTDKAGKIILRVSPETTLLNETFYPMIRASNISDNTYEPHIEETEINIQLPQITTYSGSNNVDVLTEAKPSAIKMKYY